MESYEKLAEKVIKNIFVELEASGRHVHVTKEQAQILFGHPLTPKRELSQPGQYLSGERVTVVGPKGKFENVAVLGPERPEAQVEISLTDSRELGVKPLAKIIGQASVGVDPRFMGIGPVDASRKALKRAGLTVEEVLQVGDYLGVPYNLVHKVPSDGLSGMSDEDKIGFTYAVLDKYIRTGVCEDADTKAKIDRMNKMNAFKLKPLPFYKPDKELL